MSGEKQATDKKISSSHDRVEKFYPDQNLKKKITDYCTKNHITKSAFMCDLAREFFKKQTV